MSASIPPKDPAAITAAEYPALSSFLRGYFHQDMKDEYDTPEEAVREFCADAGTEERIAVAKEWSRFMNQTKGKSLQEINRILTGPLGSSIILSSEDLERISAVLSRTSSKPGPH